MSSYSMANPIYTDLTSLPLNNQLLPTPAQTHKKNAHY